MLTKRKMVQEKTSYTIFLFRLTQTYILQLLQYVRIEIINYKVCMVTDAGDITDQSFNQTTYEACRDYCKNCHGRCSRCRRV
jgi:basic membrane lipoprotein Med (substrate-binding protein (PBP1-ABC) superfamily)